MASEPYDFLSAAVPDYDYTLILKAQEVFHEEGFKNQTVHLADDNTEEVISLSSGSIFYATIPYPILSETDSGTIHDLYHDPLKANGMGRTFKWLSHDGHIYVVRFNGKLGRTVGPGIRYGVPSVSLRLLGKLTDPVDLLTFAGSSLTLNALSLPADKTVYLYWGDDLSTTIAGPQTDYTITHNYARSGNYSIRLGGDITNVTKFHIYSQSGVSGDIGNFAVLTGLLDLRLYSTSVSGDIAYLAVLTSLTILRLYSSSVSGDIADLVALTAITSLHLYSTLINTYTQGVLPDWDPCNIYIYSLGLSQQEVDDFLCDLNTASSASTRILNIGGTNSAPSATGLACKTALEGKGWTVTVAT